MEIIRQKTVLRKNWRNFRKDKAGALALLVILIFLLAALFAADLAPYPEQGRGESNIANTLSAPSSDNLFGTDRQGRDILSRCLFGLQTSLKVALFVTFFGFIIGVPLGAIAGFFGGLLDEIIMRITDIFLSFPALLLAIALVAVLGPSLENAILALAISWWPWYARIARSSTISIKNSLFIDAARVMGVRKMTIIFRHILPNILTPVIVQVSVDMGTVILSAASLSFLGLGSQPPEADLGQMVSEGRSYILNQWWYSTFPGLLILLLVMSFNIFGDALRDLLDPKSKGRST
ncbi:MAG TPA: ABC transporter permease [Candidatus Bathyarchaeia archaeon]|nr:ABC transporter permease [Candidatus Bathyarchaeia archaeon]